jgi:hypothetical protein
VHHVVCITRFVLFLLPPPSHLSRNRRRKNSQREMSNQCRPYPIKRERLTKTDDSKPSYYLRLLLFFPSFRDDDAPLTTFFEFCTDERCLCRL